MKAKKKEIKEKGVMFETLSLFYLDNKIIITIFAV